MEKRCLTKNKYDFGDKLDTSNMIEVTNDILKSYLDLIYIPIKVYMENEKYYFVDDNNTIIYVGHSKTGDITDINHTIKLKTQFINTAIAFVLDDKKAMNLF